jgi:hypothetical protein
MSILEVIRLFQSVTVPNNWSGRSNSVSLRIADIRIRTTAVVMKRYGFCGVIPCSRWKPTEVSEECASSIFRARRISQARKWPEAGSMWLIVRPWRRRRYMAPKCGLTFDGPHVIISQHTALYIKINIAGGLKCECIFLSLNLYLCRS